MHRIASEQQFTMAAASTNNALVEAIERDGGAVKQQKVACAGHNSNPLSEAGVLQRVLGYVGPGCWLIVSLVSKDWRESYLQVPEQQIIGHCLNLDHEDISIMCVPRMTLVSSAVASPSLLQLACEFELQLGDEMTQYAVGRYGDTATLTKAHELGMLYTSWVAHGAARSGCLAKLQWLAAVVGGLDICADICDAAAASSNVATLMYLRDSGAAFTETTMIAAARAGDKHVIEYLHAEGCPWNERACYSAARFGQLGALQLLRKLGYIWVGELMTGLAAAKADMPLLEFLRAQGAAFTEETMAHAAGYGRTAVCEHLLSQ
jgi:hypothetical protein